MSPSLSPLSSRGRSHSTPRLMPRLSQDSPTSGTAAARDVAEIAGRALRRPFIVRPRPHTCRTRRAPQYPHHQTRPVALHPAWFVLRRLLLVITSSIQHVVQLVWSL